MLPLDDRDQEALVTISKVEYVRKKRQRDRIHLSHKMYSAPLIQFFLLDFLKQLGGTLLRKI
jgi:hypothetical protein